MSEKTRKKIETANFKALTVISFPQSAFTEIALHGNSICDIGANPIVPVRCKTFVQE